MGPPRDNKAGKGKSTASKNLDLPTTIEPTPASGSSRSSTTPATTHGKSAADVATAIDTTAKTLVSSNASNVQTTPRTPVKRPHEGSVVTNASRTKTSDQAISTVKSIIPLKVDGHLDDEPESAKSKSEQAQDDESDEIEGSFAAYRPVDGIGAARQSSTNPLTRGLNPVGLIIASTSTTTSNTASEASKRTASTFNTASVDDTATGANEALASIEDSTRMFGGRSAIAANPNTTSTLPKNFFTAPHSSQTVSLPHFGASGALGRPEQKYIYSGASTLSIDFGTAPTPNPTTTSPFDVLKVDETPNTPNTALASQFSVLSMLDTVPTPNPTTESPFDRPKMADTTKPDLATESPFGLLKMASTAPKSNLATHSPFSSSEAPSTFPVPNPATASPFGLFKLPHTAPGPNLAITSSFGVFETAPTHIPATTSPFDVFKMGETAPKPNLATNSPFGMFNIADTASTPNSGTNGPFGVFNRADTARTLNSTANSPFGVFNMAGTARTPNSSSNSSFGVFDNSRTPNPATSSSFDVFNKADTDRAPNTATKSLFSSVKTPAQNVFSKSNFPLSDIGNSQAKGLFGNLSEQARESKINSPGFGPTGSSNLSEQAGESKIKSPGFGPTGSSSSTFTASKITGFNTANGDSVETYNPAIFNESKLPSIQPDFNPEMAIAKGLSNTYQPMVPLGHYQPKDHSPSSPFKSLQTDNALPSANITGNSTTQQNNHFGGSLFTPTTNEITFQNPQNLIKYQNDVIRELRSDKAWLSGQNEMVSRNLAISTENLGLCGAQLQYFSKRCNDLNDTCKERREELAKLQDELDKVNETREAEKEKANLALELVKKEKYTSLSRYSFYIQLITVILAILLAMSGHRLIFWVFVLHAGYINIIIFFLL